MSKNVEPSKYRNSSRSSFSTLSKLVLMVGGAGYAAAAMFFLWSTYTSSNLNLLVPGDFTAEQAIAQLKNLSHGELLALQARQKQILAANPTDELVIKNLATLADLLGEKARIASLSLIAANRSLRDFPAQAAAIQILLAQKDYAKALYHIDGLMRSDPDHHEQLMALLVSFAENTESLAPLVNLLKETPPWRSTFINYLEQTAKQTQTSYGLLSALRKEGATVSSDEIRPLLAKLISEKSFDRANYVWLDFLSDVELRKASWVYDGGFDLDIGNRFFDWTYQPVPNVDLRLVPKSTGSIDRVVRVNFSSGKISFNSFYQLMRLQPGNYILRGEEKADNLETSVGLVWRVSCISQEPRVMGATEPLLGATAWKNFETSFSIPAAGCDTQELRLGDNARSYLDQQISGLAYYDNLSVQPADGANATP